jgi:MFS transporter, FHS family, Na+ dependent glucose transporter 1
MSTTRKAPLGNTFGYYGGFIALGISMSALGPTLTTLAENTGTVIAEISVLFLAKSLGYLAGTFLGGRLSDRLPPNALLAITLIGMALMLALTPVLSVLWLLTGVLLILGIGEGILDVGANTFLIWNHREKVGPWMNGLHFFFGVGAFLCPLIIDWAQIRTGNITWSYWILALMIVPAAMWLLTQKSPRSIVEDEETNGNARTDLPLVVLMSAFYFTFMGAELGFGGWIFTYATKLGLANESTARQMNAMFWGALTVGRLLTIPAAAYFNPRTILWTNLIGCVASLALMIAVPDNTLILWVGTFGMGAFMSSMSPTAINFAQTRMTITGKITGWFLIGGSLGNMFVPWVVGQFFESVGPLMVMYVIIAAMLAGVGIFMAILAHTRGVAHEGYET